MRFHGGGGGSVWLHRGAVAPVGLHGGAGEPVRFLGGAGGPGSSKKGYTVFSFFFFENIN